MENNTIRDFEKDEENMQLIPLIKHGYRTLLGSWKWFLLSVVTCVICGFFFQQTKERMYLRQSVMLFEEGQATGSIGMPSRRTRSGMSSLLELSGVSVGENLRNEMFILTSYRLMERVVDSLNLNIDYTADQNLHKVTLYKDSPIKVIFDKENKSDIITFEINILDEKTYEMSNLTIKNKIGKEKDIDGSWKFKAGIKESTPIGYITILPQNSIKFVSFDNKELGNEEDEKKMSSKVYVTYMPKSAAATFYHNNVSAKEFDKQSSLIVMSCKDMNPQRANDVLTEIYNAYVNDVLENKNHVAKSTIDFIDSRINLISGDLEVVEKDLAEFKKNTKIIDFKEATRAFANESSEARKFSIESETKLEIAKFLLDFLHDHSNDTEVIPMLNIERANFSPAIQDYNKLMMERNRYAKNSGEKSEAVIHLDHELAAIRTAIIQSVTSFVKTAEVQVREAHANENSLFNMIGDIPYQEKEALNIERQQLLKSNLLNFLLNKREEVAMQLAINTANVRIVEGPMGSGKPASPHTKLILFFSFILGILIPSAIIWLHSLFDTTVSDRRDIENYTSIPLAGEIPEWKNLEKGNLTPLITLTENDSPIAESLRVLRYGLNFMCHNAKVLMTTSTTPGQGKSFVSSNLSIIYSMMGKKVLLIDADIRKRTLSKSFGKTAGLTEYLVDEDNNTVWESLVIPNAITKGVDFLPSGTVPPNPSELLMSERLEKLISLAKEEYDYIIIDSTPMFSIADAGIIARVTDLVLYVIRVGVQERETLPELEKIYKTKRFPNLCVVLNGTLKDSRHSYGYGYGYGQKSDK